MRRLSAPAGELEETGLPVACGRCFSAAAEDDSALPPWARMRGGGQGASSEPGAAKPAGGARARTSAPPVASAGKPRSRVPSPARPPMTRQPPKVVVMARSPSSESSHDDSFTLATVNAPGRSSAAAAPVQDAGTPFMQRPVLTIFTTEDESPSDGASPTTLVSARQGANAEHRPRQGSGVLRVTETALSPMHHYTLYGNGMDASLYGPPASLGDSPFPQVSSTGAAPESRPRLPPAAGALPAGLPLEAAGRALSGCSSSRLSSYTEFYSSDSPGFFSPSPAPAPSQSSARGRVSATPVVPINPYNEPSTRRRLAQDMAQRYGPGAAKDPAEEETVAALLREHEQQQQQQQTDGASRPAREDAKIGKPPRKEDVQAKKKADEKASSAAKKSGTATPSMTREQVIRVGVTRLQQRLCALHLAVCRVKNDGNCQFRALAQQLLGSEDYHDLIRAQVVSYMRHVRAEKFDFYFGSQAAADTYFAKLAKLGTWGDELSLRGASDALFVNVHVLSSAENNCYSCYRPSEDVSSAPSFLVDVAKIKERRRRERQFKRWQRRNFTHLRVADTSAAHSLEMGATDCSDDARTPPPCTACSAGSDDEREEREAERKDEELLDANAIQLALAQKLQHKRIKSSVPFFTPDGQLRNPRERGGGQFVDPHSAFSLGVHSRSNTAYSSMRSFGSAFNPGLAGPSPTSTPSAAQTSTLLAPPRVPSRGDASAEETRPAEPVPLLVPLTVAPAPGADGGTLCDGATGGACATAADAPHFRMNSFGATGEDAVHVTRYARLARPPSRLLRPAVDSAAASATPPLQSQQQQQSTGGGSFPVFPTLDGGNVMLLASSPLRTEAGGFPAADAPLAGQSSQGEPLTTQTLKQSFAALGECTMSHTSVPSAATSLTGLAADYTVGSGSLATNPLLDGSPQANGDEEVVFVFEPRTAPIDVFLSYLYPVHYNALCIVEEDSDHDEAAASGTSEKAPEKPKFINASFLRTTVSTHGASSLTSSP